MNERHLLEDWLAAHAQGLGPAGLKAVTGRGADLPDRPRVSWISFETAQAAGRLTLWSSGRCRSEGTSHGAQPWSTERSVATTADVDEELRALTERLDPPATRRPAA